MQRPRPQRIRDRLISLPHPALQIYVRPTLEAVELKMMDTSQASSLGLQRDCVRFCCPCLILRLTDRRPTSTLSLPLRPMLQSLTSPRNLLTRFLISVVYVATVTCIGCAVRAPAAWLLRGD